MQAINENIEETLIRQHKRLIKRKRGKYKDEKEGRPTFMITTSACVWEVCVVKGNIASVSAKVEDKRDRRERQQITEQRKSVI